MPKSPLFFFSILLLSSTIFIGCSEEPRAPSQSSGSPAAEPTAQPSAQIYPVTSDGYPRNFRFVLAKGVGEWNLEPLLLSTPIYVYNYDLTTFAENIPYYGKASAEMIRDGVTVRGRFDREKGTIEGTYTIWNTEKSPALTYEQGGEGKITGTVDKEKRTITVLVQGLKHSITKDNGREMSRIDNKTNYTFTVPIIEQ